MPFFSPPPSPPSVPPPSPSAPLASALSPSLYSNSRRCAALSPPSPPLTPPPAPPLHAVPVRARYTSRSFRVLEKGNRQKKQKEEKRKKRKKRKKGGGKEKDKTTEKGAPVGLPGPTDRRERQRESERERERERSGRRDSCRGVGGGEKSDHWCGAQITERRGRNN